MASLLTLLLLLTTPFLISTTTAQSRLCRTACGSIPIHYPLSLDDGCGSPYYRRLLICSSFSTLHLRTPSGIYPIQNISYTDPHLIVTDPTMWSCYSTTPAALLRPSDTPPFALDTSTHLTLSPKNNYLFFNCSKDSVFISPKPRFCEIFPDRCPSACDSAGYLCRNLPGCPNALRDTGVSCCTYYPKASESMRLMLKYCTTYTSVYWRAAGGGGGGGGDFPPYTDQVAEYGVRVDFEIPVTTRCLQCMDVARGGGGTCGFDTESGEFLCLCKEGNVTTHCGDEGGFEKHRTMAGIIVGTTMGVSIGGILSGGVLVWYLRKPRTSRVACGVQSNENRLF